MTGLINKTDGVLCRRGGHVFFVDRMATCKAKNGSVLAAGYGWNGQLPISGDKIVTLNAQGEQVIYRVVTFEWPLEKLSWLAHLEEMPNGRPEAAAAATAGVGKATVTGFPARHLRAALLARAKRSATAPAAGTPEGVA
jgi:hypothetical protein